MFRRELWRSLSLIAAIIIFATSSTVIGSRAFVHGVAQVAPGTITEQGFSHFWDSWWWVFVKGYHVSEFAVLTLLVGKWLSDQPVWVAAALAAAYAATDEIHQLWVPARGGRVTDWLIDLIGVSAASVILLVLRNSAKKHPRLDSNQRPTA